MLKAATRTIKCHTLKAIAKNVDSLLTLVSRDLPAATATSRLHFEGRFCDCCRVWHFMVLISLTFLLVAYQRNIPTVAESATVADQVKVTHEVLLYLLTPLHYSHIPSSVTQSPRFLLTMALFKQDDDQIVLCHVRHCMTR